MHLYVMEINISCVHRFKRTHPELFKPELSNAITIVTGDQSSAADLDAVYRKAGSAPFDVVIDDASHISEHQTFTLRHFARQRYVARPDGAYFVEDLYGSCSDTPWRVMGDLNRWVRGGTSDCMGSQANPSFFAHAVGWQKDLIRGVGEGAALFRHVDFWANAAAFQL